MRFVKESYFLVCVVSIQLQKCYNNFSDNMKEYNIVITETLEKVMKINGENEIDALTKVKEMYSNEKVILDADCFMLQEKSLNEK